MPPRKAPNSSRTTTSASGVKPPSSRSKAPSSNSRPPSSRAAKKVADAAAAVSAVDTIPEDAAVDSAPAPPPNGTVDIDGVSPMSESAPGQARDRSSTAASSRKARPSRGAVTPTETRASERATRRMSVAAVGGATSKRTTRAPRKSVATVPDLNEPPKPFEHIRPPRSVFVFGDGGMGQFGLGEETLDSIKRPRLHAWFEANRSTGKLGDEEDCGPEQVVAANGLHSLAIDEKGRVWSWGVNDNAALGRQTAKVPKPDSVDGTQFYTTEELEMTPAVVPKLEKEGFRAVRVAGGDSVSVAISDVGQMKVWGSFRGDQGLIGFGGVANAKQVDPVGLKDFHDLRHIKWVSLACGNDFVVALTSKGQVYTFGSNDHNQLGRRRMGRGSASLRATDPQSVGLHDVVVIGAGNYHGFAVKKDGKVYAWGVNTHGQCGLDETYGDVVASPTVVPELGPDAHDGAKVVSITGGDHHTLFLYDNGQVWAVGSNVDNQLGLADDNPAKADKVYDPVQVIFPPPPEDDEDTPELGPYQDTEEYKNRGTQIVAISAGTHNNLAVSKDGHLYSWGQGTVYQLGLGPAETEAETPTLVRNTALRGVQVMNCSAGGQHCFIVGQKKV